MTRFILGFVCGVAVAILVPQMDQGLRNFSAKPATPAPVVVEIPPTPSPNWRLDPARGTLNQPVRQ